MYVDAHRPWRHAKVTDRRTRLDFAECMRDLVDVHYPDAERIRVVLDNLSTHTQAALHESFEPAEARRILRRLEFHYTPKHASWLNMVEIEIGVMVSQCLDRRIPTKALLVKEVNAWQRRRSREKVCIRWQFTVDKARKKLGRAYPARAAANANQALPDHSHLHCVAVLAQRARRGRRRGRAAARSRAGCTGTRTAWMPSKRMRA